MSTVTPFSSVSQFIEVLEGQNCTYAGAVESTSPVVSIISSFFNAHRYFEATYRSIINQTFQNFEWIIVDDCSTEPDAIALFQTLPSRSKKIKILQHRVNRGLSSGRNTAIAEAVGQYLYFMDLDDLLDPTCIEKCVLFLETHSEFSFVNSYTVGFQAQEYWWEKGFDQPGQFIQQNPVTGRLLYRKADFDLLGGFDETLRFYEDWERWVRAIAHQQKGWTIPEYLDCYRRLDTGLLATALANLPEEQRVTELIQSRYQALFEQNYPANPTLDRTSFDVHRLRSRLDIGNLVDHAPDGKRVLCLFPHLEIGGGDKFNLDLVTLLTQREYGITIVTTLQSHHPWQSHFYPIVPDIFHLSNFLPEDRYLAFLIYLIQSRQIDLVLISNSYLAYYLLPLLKAEFPHLAVVDLTHAADPGWRGFGYPRVSCQFQEFLQYQVVTSEALATDYRIANSATEENLKVCYTNVDTQHWIHSSSQRRILRSRLDIPDQTIVLLFPARFTEQKRPLFLVDIVQALVKHHLPIVVIAIGSGHLLGALQEKVRQLDLNAYFQILPPAQPDEMLDFYSAADILLLPSAYEGISLAIYEAMAMSLPVVGAAVGGQTELVTPETGFLIPKGNSDAEEVQAYLQVLRSLIVDQSLRDRIGRQARQRVVENFPLSSMADRMEEIFAAAITKAQMEPPLEVNSTLAEETLMLGLDYLHQDQTLHFYYQHCHGQAQTLNALSHEKSLIEQERNCIDQERQELARLKQAMESSKFWKLRRLWFKVKRQLRLSQEPEL